MSAFFSRRHHQAFSFIWPLASWGLLAGMLFGCSSVTPAPPNSAVITGTVDVYHPISNKAKPNWAPPTLHGPRDYKIVGDFMERGDKDNGNRIVYNDRNLMVKDTDFGAIHGGHLIQTSFEDWNKADEKLMELVINDDLEALYIAYEESVDTPPSWLTQDYKRLPAPGNASQFCTLTLSNDRKLQIWRKNEVPRKNDRVTLSGNKAGDPRFIRGSQPTHPYMYAVIITPPREYDWSGREKDSTYYYRGCEDLRSARSGASIDHGKEARQGNASCASGSNDTRCEVGSMTTFYTRGNNSCELTVNDKSFPIPAKAYFRQGSIIELDSNVSAAKISFAKEKDEPPATALVPVRGRLYFDYEANEDKEIINRININTLEFTTPDFSLEDKRVSVATVNLVKSGTANCSDQTPLGPLCKKYRIEPEELVLALSFVVGDSGYWYVGAYNTQPIDVDIDAANYTFRFSPSTFQSSVVIDGKTRAADVSLDLLGKFVNIAPLVSFKVEKGPHAECGDGVNNASIIVIAKAFNPPGTLQPGNFTWYRDYGLPTQVTWNQGHVLAIQKGELGYGSHNFSVVYTDKYGSRDDKKIKVDVGDTTPPSFTVIPPDKNVSATKQDILAGGIEISLGKAEAKDACLPGGVVITSDPPPGYLFPEGTTVVTWTADDLRGNKATKEQRVTVNVLP